MPVSIANGATPASMLPQDGCGVDDRLADIDLREQVIDIDAGPRRLRHDRDLAGERVGAAEPVDLARIGRAHRGEQHAVARGHILRQVARP